MAYNESENKRKESVLAAYYRQKALEKEQEEQKRAAEIAARYQYDGGAVIDTGLPRSDSLARNDGGVVIDTGDSSALPQNDKGAVTEEKKNKGGILGGLGYLGHELILGGLRSIEGVVDYVGGGLLDLFGADEKADEWLKTDWVNYNAADEWYNPSGAMEFVGDVANGVGGMLPAVATSFIPGVGAALSTAMFGTGAAGQAVSEQTKKNGSAGAKEWLYGTASGAAEAAIEAVSGGIGGTKVGKVLGKNLAKSTAGKVATSFIGEGIEEVASDILNPYLQRATGVDKDAKVDWGNLPRTFFVGGATGAVMGGAGRVMNAAKAGGFNNLQAAETAAEMDERMSDNNVRQALGKKEIYTQSDMTAARDRLSQNLQKMDEPTRSAFLKQVGPRVASIFNADGTVKQEVWENMRSAQSAGRFSVEKSAKTNSQTVGNFSGITYSSSLKGRESTLKYQPVAAEQATEYAKAALRNIELVSGGRVDVVLTDGANLTTADGRQVNGEYADGVVYVNANADSYERAMFIASHELTHTLEGTGEYQRLGEFIKERVAADPALAKKYDLEKYRAAYDSAQAGDFSAETLEYQAKTEMYADFVAKEVLGNEDVVRRLAAKQRNIAVRFLEWVRSAVRRLGGGRETQAEYKALKKAEKLLSAALENAKGGVTLEEVEEDVQTAKAVKAFFEGEGEGDSSATRQNDSVEQKETTDEKSVGVGAQSSARYSLSEGAEQAVENALADKNYGGEVKLTDVSPSILLGQEGVRNLPMMMKASHIRENIFTEKEAKAKGLKVDKNINYHGLGKTLFLKVIEDLDNVTEAYRGTKNADNPARREKYFLLISKQTDGNGNIINVPVYINEKGIYNRAFIDTNKIATVFGKDAIYSYIREQISKGNLVRIKKRNIQTSESTAPIAANYGKNVSTTIIRENSEKSTENAKKVEKTSEKSSRKSLDVEDTEEVKSEMKSAGSETEDVKKDVDNITSSRYNISKRTTKYISYSSIGEDNIRYIRAELVRLYDGLESGIADGIAIERDSTVYIVDSGKDRGDISFGIRKKISISNDELRVEFIRRTNNESISKGFISDGLSSRIRGKHDNDRGSDRRYQTGEKLSADTGKSENQQKRISDENAVGGGSVRHSLDVDSEIAKKKQKKKDTLRKYLGRMEITEDTKERLRFSYGDTVAQRIIDTWENTSDEKGASFETVRLELEEQGVYLDMYYDSDILSVMEEISRGEALKRVEKEKARAFQEIVQTEISIENLSKEEAGLLVNNLLAKHMEYEGTLGKIGGKTKAEVLEMLTKKMNAIELSDWKRRAALARKIASYIIDHTVFENVYVEMSGDYGDALAVDLLTQTAKGPLKHEMAKEILREFNKRINVSQLEKKFDNFQKRVDRWREKYYDEISKRDTLERVVRKAEKLSGKVKGEFKKASEYNSGIFEKTVGMLGRVSYRGNLNKSSTRILLYNLLGWYSKDNPLLKDEGIFNPEIEETLRYLAENQKPMTAEQAQTISELQERLKKYDYPSLRDWYTQKNMGDKYQADIKQLLNDMSKPSEFTADELKMLENVMDYFNHFIDNYNKVYRRNKLVDAVPLAQEYVEKLQKNKRNSVGWWGKLSEGFLRIFGDPMALARYYDKYDSGFYTDTMTELRDAAVAAQVMETKLHAPLEEFYGKNKKFLQESQQKTVKYQGVDLPVQQAMALYMTLKRDQALKGLALAGFSYKKQGDYDDTRMEGFAQVENPDMEYLRDRAAELRAELKKQFSETELEYIKIVEKLFNEECKQAKYKTDMLRQGYSNILEGYYFPIRRSSLAKRLDVPYLEEMQTLNSYGFNKDVVKGAGNELYIDSLTEIVDKHISGISQYSCLALAVDSYGVLFNLNVSDNPYSVMNVSRASGGVWREADEYFRKLMSDIRGVSPVKDDKIVTRVLGTMRGGYAKYQLAGNLKVLATQFSSLIAAGNVLDVGNIVGGLGVGLSDKNGALLDKYCGLAMARNSENTAALAQGVLEKTGKIGDVLMKPIGWMDRFVVKCLFGACQTQVEKQGGGKVGSEENLTAAGELLERVILETQQNALATERSSAMRSGNEILKSLTMFSADSMKLTGRLIDAFGEVSVVRKLLKSATDTKEIERLKKRLEVANKQAGRSMASMLSSAIFMALLTLGFKWVYDKDDKDEDIGKNLLTDMVGNMLGGLPFIRDIYSYFADGYEVNNALYSSFNDLLNSFVAVRDLCADAMKGKTVAKQELPLTIRKMIYAIGQLTGIPTRNLFNTVRGIIGWDFVSPSTAYKIDDLFYKGAYRSDLAKAIAADDGDMIATIVGLMLNENVGGVTDAAAREAIDTLVQAGYDVIPSGVPSKITFKTEDENGDEVKHEIELAAADVKAFNEVYLQANEQVASLVQSTWYKSASQDVQAAAIGFIYDTYYETAKEGLLETELETDILTKAKLFSSAIDMDKLAVAIATAKTLTADIGRDGKAISGSRKTKVQRYVNSLRLTAVQKYMIMGYLGYTNANGADAVKAYIRRLKLTDNEKAALYKYSGYGA